MPALLPEGRQLKTVQPENLADSQFHSGRLTEELSRSIKSKRTYIGGSLLIPACKKTTLRDTGICFRGWFKARFSVVCKRSNC